MKTKITTTILALAIGAAATTATLAKDITVKGSDTMVILGQKWAELYMKNNPDQVVQVTGGGSGTGVAALLNGTTDICNASRSMKPKEVATFVKTFKTKPHEYRMCLDGLSVYVSASNPIQSLSVDQLDDIFTAKITNWKEVGGPDMPISLYGRENSSGTYEFFKEHVLKKKDFAAATKTMPGTAAVIQGVAKDKNAIGYGGIAYAEGVRAVKVSATENDEAVEPTEENVVSGRYPISRYLFYYVAPSIDTGAVKEYIDWCLSDEGQAVVKNVGYFPLPKHAR